MSSQVTSTASPTMSVTRTFAPARANASALAHPIPLPSAVTNPFILLRSGLVSPFRPKPDQAFALFERTLMS